MPVEEENQEIVIHIARASGDISVVSAAVAVLSGLCLQWFVRKIYLCGGSEFSVAVWIRNVCECHGQDIWAAAFICGGDVFH